MDDNKDMKILVKFKDNKNVRRNYDRDYLAYRQILIGTGDKIFYFKQVQEKFVGNVLDVGYDLYNWIEKQGLDFDCFYKLDGQISAELRQDICRAPAGALQISVLFLTRMI